MATSAARNIRKRKTDAARSIQKGDIVTTKKTKRKYQVVEFGDRGPLFQYLMEDRKSGEKKLYGPTMILNPKRYVIDDPGIVTTIVPILAQTPRAHIGH